MIELEPVGRAPSRQVPYIRTMCCVPFDASIAVPMNTEGSAAVGNGAAIGSDGSAAPSVQRRPDLHVEHVGALAGVRDLEDPPVVLAAGGGELEVLITFALEPALHVPS